nr:immunoglobulin light chain junction region [Macaca mulatta]
DYYCQSADSGFNIF